jgi:hypothetical protein
VPPAGSAAGPSDSAVDGVGAAAALIRRDVRRLADRLRKWRHAQWLEPAEGGRSRRELVATLVALLADAGQAAEGIAPPTRRRVSAPAYDAAWSDRLRVVGADLTRALTELAVGTRVSYAGRELSLTHFAGAVLAQVSWHAALLENRAPAEDAAQLALRLLDQDVEPPYAEVLARLGGEDVRRLLPLRG